MPVYVFQHIEGYDKPKDGFVKINYNFDLIENFILTGTSGSFFTGGTVTGPTNFLSTISSGGTNLDALFSSAAHTHQLSSILNTAHTHTYSEVTNISALLDTKASLSGANFSGVIQSGGTDLSLLFQPIGPGSQSTFLQNGLNTYTGGTTALPTVNVSGLSINNIAVSGSASFSILSATTFYSGSTELSEVFKIRVENTTHASLSISITNKLLTPGQYYKITDFYTHHQIPSTSEFNSGATEPIIVCALSSNSLHVEAKSEQYPNDIIHYRWNDASCEDGGYDYTNNFFTGGTARPGKIIYRKDTIRELSAYYDWRNVKFRRWSVSASTWDNTGGTTTYNSRDVVSYNSIVYVCKYTNNSITAPSSDSLNWHPYLDSVIYGPFFSWTSDASEFSLVGAVSSANMVINNSTPETDYEDFYTFTILTNLTNSSGVIPNGTGLPGGGYKKFELGHVDYVYTVNKAYNNIVFFFLPKNNVTDLDSYGNFFGSQCYENTICTRRLNNNNFGDGFCNNVVVSNNSSFMFANNSFKSSTTKNVFKGGCTYNDFKTKVTSNIFGYGKAYNSFEQSVSLNITGDGFATNKISSNFYNNKTESSFSNNNIGDNFNSNEITGSTFQYNSIDNDFKNNVIGPSFLNNKVGSNVQFISTDTIFQKNVLENYINETVDNSAVVFGPGVQYNTFRNGCFGAVSGADLVVTGSTHMSGSYNCDIYMRSDGTTRLKFYDGGDVLNFYNVTE